MSENEKSSVEANGKDMAKENILDEMEQEALKKLKRLERDYISPDSGITSGLALPPARYVYIVGLLIALFLLLYLLAASLESGLKKKPSPVKESLQNMEKILKK